jgi:hypothetical protein
MRRLNKRNGGYVVGYPIETLPDGILYLGEDGVPFSKLNFVDAADDVKAEFGYSPEKAAEYHQALWQKEGHFKPETREAEENVRIITEIVSEYHKNHTYSMKDLFVCVDMANDVWNMVQTKGIRAKVRIGNGGPAREIKSVLESNHAWVMAEVSPGTWLALEATGGQVVARDEANRRYYAGVYHDFSSPKQVKSYQTLGPAYNDAQVKRARAAEEYNQAVNQFNDQVAVSGPFSGPADRYARESLAAEVGRRKAVLDERENDLAVATSRLSALLSER